MTNQTEEKPKAVEERYDFSPEFQENIVAWLLHEPNASDVVKPEFFDNQILGEFVVSITKFFSKYSRLPDTDEFLEEVDTLMSAKKYVPVEDYCITAEKVLAASEKKDFAYVRDKAIEFARYEAMKNAVLEGAVLLKDKRDYAGVAKKIQQAYEIADNLTEGSEHLDTVNLGTVERKEVEWFWPNKIPKGKLSLIVGDPDVGKSFFTMMLAAGVSTGERWPRTSPEDQESRAEKGRVIILTAEDGLADTVVPRIEDHGGDTTKVISIRGTKERDGTRMFNLLEDVKRLEDLVARMKDVKLIIIDPVSAYLGAKAGIDSHKDRDVRGVLGPVAALAEKYNITIVGVLHLNKSQDIGAIYRVSGSVAFVAAARAVWLITCDRAQGLRYFAPIKANLSIDPEGLVFTIDPERGVITPQNTPCPNVSELLKPMEKKSQRKSEEAEEFLRDMLRDGPVESRKVFAEARQLGISQSTIKRVKDELGIHPLRRLMPVVGVGGTIHDPSRQNPQGLKKRASTSL